MMTKEERAANRAEYIEAEIIEILEEKENVGVEWMIHTVRRSLGVYENEVKITIEKMIRARTIERKIFFNCCLTLQIRK